MADETSTEPKQFIYIFYNSGKNEIRSADILIPLTLDLGESKLLDYRIDNINPPHITNMIEMKHDDTKNNLTIDFSHFRSEESIRFSLFIDGELPEPLNGYLRVEGLESFKKINKFKEIGDEDNLISNKIFSDRHPWVIYLLWILAVPTILLFLVLLFELRGKKRVKQIIADGLYLEELTLPELRNFLDQQMGYLASEKRARIAKVINSVEMNDDSKRFATIAAIEDEIFDKSTIYASIFLLVIILPVLYFFYAYYS